MTCVIIIIIIIIIIKYFCWNNDFVHAKFVVYDLNIRTETMFLIFH
jgi:hypothetical protein